MAQNYITADTSFTGSNVNYFDIPMEYSSVGSNAGKITPNSTWYIWANPTSTYRFRFQILNSSGTAQTWSWQGMYSYVSTNGVRFAANETTFYNQYDTVNTTYGSGIKMQIGFSGGSNSSDPMQVFYSVSNRPNTSYGAWDRGVITPTSQTASDWTTLRCYFNNTSSAYVSSYRVYSGI